VQSFIQLIKYGVVGLASNLLLYLLYICLTMLGMEPKLAMTLLYLAGIMQTFMVNRRWTFQHAGIARPALIRYFMAYGFGYLVNLLSLYLLVDLIGFPHQGVQAAMIVVLACMLFLLQKFWVFRDR